MQIQPFRLVYRPFPADCGGMVPGLLSGAGGRLLIAIDSNQDTETQARALRHELAHLVLNHLEDERPLRELEAEADMYADQMTETEFSELMKGAIV